MEFKVGDKVIITGYKESDLNKSDVGKIIIVEEITQHRGFTALFAKAFQNGTDPDKGRNYVVIGECRLATPLEELL